MAGGAVGGEMVLPRLDVVLRLTARAVEPLIERLGATALQVGDDKASIGSLGAGLDPRDNALDPAPAAGSIVELRKAPHLAARRCHGEALGSGFLQRLDMAPQRRIGSQPQHPIDPVLSAPVEDFRAGVVRIGAQQSLPRRRPGISTRGQKARIAPTRRRRKARISWPPGRLPGRNSAVTKRPSPSNTTIGWKP